MSAEHASLWLLLLTPLSHVTAWQQSGGIRGAKYAFQNAKGLMFARHVECLVKWEQEELKPKVSIPPHSYRPDINTSANITVSDIWVNPPTPYLRARWIWQQRRWAWGRRWHCQSDTPQWTWGCLRWPAEGCTGTLQRCTATALLWREWVFLCERFIAKGEKKEEKGKNMHMYRSSEWRRREIRGWGLRTPQRKGKDSG